MFSEADSFLISVIYRSKQQKKPYSQRPGAEEKSATIQSPKTVRPYPKSTVIPQLKGSRKRGRTRILTDNHKKMSSNHKLKQKFL